jgi:hypothetical protein
MDVARTFGLTDDPVSGTIDEADVLSALAELAEGDVTNEDLYDDAAARVRESRSAGLEEFDPTSWTAPSRGGAPIQLRYRSEMAEIFTDLAIDIGLRDYRALADAAT